MQEKLVTIDNIQKTVAEYYKNQNCGSRFLSVDSLGKARPRQMAAALAKSQPQFAEIGDAFGGRDHNYRNFMPVVKLSNCGRKPRYQRRFSNFNQNIVVVILAKLPLKRTFIKTACQVSGPLGGRPTADSRQPALLRAADGTLSRTGTDLKWRWSRVTPSALRAAPPPCRRARKFF